MVATQQIIVMGALENAIRNILQQNPGNNRTWDLSDPSAHYVLERQARDYLSLASQPEYAHGMHAQEIMLLENNKKGIVQRFAPIIHYWDFGPGSGDKSAILVKEAMSQHKATFYHGIDVSETILAQALQTIGSLHIPTKGFLGDFTQDYIRARNMTLDAPAFIYLGATFGNFSPTYMLEYLKKVMRHGDTTYISCQRKPEHINDILKQYGCVKSFPFVFFAAQQLGFRPEQLDTSIQFNPTKERVEISSVVLEIPPVVERLLAGVIRHNDTIIHAISLKPSVDYFKELISDEFKNAEFYVTKDFVGATVGMS